MEHSVSRKKWFPYFAFERVRRWRTDIRVEGNAFFFLVSFISILFLIIFEPFARLQTNKKLFDLDLCKFHVINNYIRIVHACSFLVLQFCLQSVSVHATSYALWLFICGRCSSTFEIWMWLVLGLFFFRCIGRDNNFWIRFNTNLNRKLKTGKWKGFKKCCAHFKEIFSFSSSLQGNMNNFFVCL